MNSADSGSKLGSISETARAWCKAHLPWADAATPDTTRSSRAKPRFGAGARGTAGHGAGLHGLASPRQPGSHSLHGTQTPSARSFDWMRLTPAFSMLCHAVASEPWVSMP